MLFCTRYKMIDGCGFAD